MVGQFEVCETSAGPMEIFLAGERSSPPLIVIQEAFGVNAHIQSVCERLAAEGYFVAAPELYHRSGARIELPYGDRMHILPKLAKLRNEEIVSDLFDTISFLKKQKMTSSDVSTIGFCMGGFSSVLAATELPVKKMISFYGAGIVHRREGVGLTPILDQLKKIKAECLFFFGEEDGSIPSSDIKAIRQALESSQIKHEIVIYSGADHGFFCDERKSYNAVASEKAWKKVLEFLGTRGGRIPSSE